MIAVTGATGTVGSELVRLLTARDADVRAIVRSPAEADLPDGVDTVFGDFAAPASMRAALDGADRAFLLTPSTEDAETWQTAFVSAAADAGVRHLTVLSQLHADAGAPERFLAYHGVVEDAVREAGLDYTFLRPNLYMQGLIGFRQPIAEEGILPIAGGEARVSAVDVRDVAEVATEALTTEDHFGAAYELTGPETLSFSDMARILSEATDRETRYVDVPPEATREAFVAFGAPAWQADGLVEELAMYRRGAAEVITDGVEQAIGRPPRSFAAFARDHAALFTPPVG